MKRVSRSSTYKGITENSVGDDRCPALDSPPPLILGMVYVKPIRPTQESITACRPLQGEPAHVPWHSVS